MITQATVRRNIGSFFQNLKCRQSSIPVYARVWGDDIAAKTDTTSNRMQKLLWNHSSLTSELASGTRRYVVAIFARHSVQQERYGGRSPLMRLAKRFAKASTVTDETKLFQPVAETFSCVY